MSKPAARRPMAWPMPPKPSRPMFLPCTRVISGRWPVFQPPARTKRVVTEMPRATSIARPMARSATQPSSTSGVLLICMPWRLAVSTSILS